jgi:hypothetical protein
VGCGDCQKKPAPTATTKLDVLEPGRRSYSVISLNPMDEEPQPYWADKRSAIPGGTASGRGDGREGRRP